MIPELRTVLEAQRRRVEEFSGQTGRVVPWIFCRDDGAPVRGTSHGLATACIAAGTTPHGAPVLDAAGAAWLKRDGTPQVTKKPTLCTWCATFGGPAAARNLIRAGISGPWP